MVALGGNAITREFEEGNISQQFANTRQALKDVVRVIKQGHKVVITHGNGPQVGAIVIRTEMTKRKAYYIPLGVAVAETQGEIGYMIEQSLQNALKAKRIKRDVATILERAQSGQLHAQLELTGLDRPMNRLVYGIVIAALFMGSALLWANDVPPRISVVSIIGAAGTILSLIFGLNLLHKIRKSGGLD